MNAAASYILTIACEDRVGIVAGVRGWLAEADGFILDSQQYADLDAGRFFMRVEFKGAGPSFPARLAALRAGFEPVAARLGLDWELVAAAERPRLLIAVSKSSHCLNDLLHRWHTGDLPVEIVGVVSNHPDFRELTSWYGIPFHHLPVTGENRAAQEAEMLGLLAGLGADYLILARYMQILSAEMTEALAGRCINIHHSFLPSFKGAKP